MIMGSAILGVKCCRYFWGTHYRSIFADLLPEEISGTGDPPTTLQKISKMLLFSIKKPQMGIFSNLRDENRVPEGWGGVAQVWAGKKLCSPNPSKITQKKISDQAHPLPCEIGPSKMRVLVYRKSQNRVCLCA